MGNAGTKIVRTARDLRYRRVAFNKVPLLLMPFMFYVVLFTVISNNPRRSFPFLMVSLTVSICCR